MAKLPRPWIVTPHGPLEKHEDNLWTVEGDIPGLAARRRMAIVRLGDGRLVFFNAIPLEPAALCRSEGMGKAHLAGGGAQPTRHRRHALRAGAGPRRRGCSAPSS